MTKQKLPDHVRAFRGKRGTTFASWIPLGRSSRKKWTPRFKDPDEAAACRERWLRNLATISRDDLTFQRAVDRVEERLRTTRSAGTLKWFKSHSSLLVEWFGAGTSLISIDAKDIERWRDDQRRGRKGRKPVTASTVLHRRRALSLIFSDNRSSLLEGRNPMDMVRRGWPTVEVKEAPFFRMDELAALLERIRTSGHETAAEDADVLAALALTGLRRTEFSRVRIQDVHLEDRALFVQGKKRNERMAVGTEAVAVLARMLERAKTRAPQAGPQGSPQADILFLGGPEGLSNLARRWAIALGEKRLRCHTLRHSFVTGLVSSGLGLATVQRLARHAVVQMTARYFHGSGDEADALSRLTLSPQPKGPKPVPVVEKDEANPAAAANERISSGA